MTFDIYKSNFDLKLSRLEFEPGTLQEGIGCETKAKPAMPPWVLDWAVLFVDGHHIRVKETYRPMLHPRYNEGQRLHFCYHYGATTARDLKGMPLTALDRDTIIRVDCDPWGPHIHYRGRNHVKQVELTGPFVIDKAEVFEFIEAVQTHRHSGSPMHEILLFEFKREVKR